MALEDRIASSAMSSVAFSVSGVLSMIPAIQEVFLDRKLNKASLAQEMADNNSFRPDLVARHVRDNGAVFIGCEREYLDQIREALERSGVPYIAMDSSMVEDAAHRPPQPCTVVIRDVDGDRAADALQEIFEAIRQAEGPAMDEPDISDDADIEEEEDLEHEIGEEEPDAGIEDPDDDSGHDEEGPEAEDDDDWGLDDIDEDEDEDKDSEKEKKKKAEQEKKKEKRRERLREQRREENRRRNQQLAEEARRATAAGEVRRAETDRRDADARRAEQDRRNEESRRAERDRRSEESRRSEETRRTEESRRREEERRNADSRRDQDARRPNDSARDDRKQDSGRREEERRQVKTDDYGNQTSYRDAYSIRAAEVEAQCERFAQAELMRREMERMKLSGEDGSEAYAQLKKQYNSVDSEIRAHHDDFQSIAKGGWRDYAAEAVERARNASTEELRDGSWQKPDAGRYMSYDSDGGYRAYNDRDRDRYERRSGYETPYGDSRSPRDDSLYHDRRDSSPGVETPTGPGRYSNNDASPDRREPSHGSETPFGTKKPDNDAYPGFEHPRVETPPIGTRDDAPDRDRRYSEQSQQSRKYSFTSVAPGNVTVNQVGSGYTIQASMSRQNLSPVCGGILASGGSSAFGTDDYFRKGSSGQAAFSAIANPVEAARAGNAPRPGFSFAGFSEATQAASAAALGGLGGRRRSSGANNEEDFFSGGSPGNARSETGHRERYHEQQMQRLDVLDARAKHAFMDMARNRSFAMVAKMGARTVVQSTLGDTEAGSVIMSASYAVQMPAHMIKQQFLNAGRTAIDQGDAAMTALNTYIVRSRAESALGMNQEELAKFASMHNLDLKQLQAAQGDKAAMERLIASHYGGTMRVPGQSDVDGLINTLGIRGDLGADGKLGKDEILAFMGHQDETTLAQRARALGKAGELDGLTDSQKQLVESLFKQGGSLGAEDMKALLMKNGVSADLAGKLAGGNWAANADIMAALSQAGISKNAADALMKELGGVALEDRVAMIGLFQLHVGDSLESAGMDEFRNLLGKLNVDQSLKDVLNNEYIHLSHLSMKDIRALLAKYKGNPEAEAFLSRMMNEKICQILGRNREVSRFELFNGIEGMLFRLAQGTDAMAGANQVMSITRAATRITRGGYKLIYNMVFRRMNSPITIGKLKVNPLDLTEAKMKEAVIKAASKTRLGAGFQRITRRVPQGVKKAVGHVLHPGKALGKLASKGAGFVLQKLGLSAAAKALSAQLTSLVASISEIALPVVLIILAVIVILMMYESIDLGGDESSENSYSAAYVSAADGKDAFVQEVVDMLRGYTDDFINEINNAQYNRSMFAGMGGYTTNENVSAYEANSFKVVFRGPDGEPIDDLTSVDLNNSKDIISMASVFIPTVFSKPSDDASEEQKQEYEKDKEHFMDYCTFLWAASHQISIEEYHPGNAENPDAEDDSGLQTDEQTGKCAMDYATGGDQGAGVNWWIGTGADPNSGDLCLTCSSDNWYDTSITLHECVAKPAADPCTHGHWEVESTDLVHAACTGHSNRTRGSYSCADVRSTLSRWDRHPVAHKRVWVCDGHMGAVVYVTVGHISRMPNFGAAKDYDLDNPETLGGTGIYSYFGGTGGIGSTAFHGTAYALTDDQIKYLAAMCIAEQGACATNEVTMRYQASLMANVYELYGVRMGKSFYDYIRLDPRTERGWFDSNSHAYADAHAASLSGQCLEWFRDVICNGNRITKANEQGTLESGFVKAVYQGREYTGTAMENESIYVPGETVLYTSDGQACLFEAFPGGHPKGCGSPVVDPFAIIIN